MLRLDNTENKRIVEMCYRTHKTVVNPIVDWSDAEVWEFIKEYDIPYCKLYDEGYKRLGCVGCPMSTRQAEELERYPRFKALYLKAFDNMLKEYKKAGIRATLNWNDAEDVMKWWLQQDELPQTIITEALENE